MGGTPNWDRLLAGNSSQILEALRAWFGPRRIPDLEMEHGYWETLAARCTADELAKAVLERLEFGGERLLDLELSDLSRLRCLLECEARDRLGHLELTREERDRIGRHSFLLAEVVFEERGHLPSAAALYALAHETTVGQDTFSLYEAVLLRFKLGNALLLMDERPERRRSYIGLVRKAADLAEAMRASERAPHDALRALTLEVRIWLGHRQEEIGDLEAAAESFRAAVSCSATPDDKVECAARAASVLAACGRKLDARELLLSVWGEVASVEDGMVRDLWEAILWSLGER
jgi:tetratricopeptide (TPR) repeat protein